MWVRVRICICDVFVVIVVWVYVDKVVLVVIMLLISIIDFLINFFGFLGLGIMVLVNIVCCFVNDLFWVDVVFLI